jgi:hypothetical protein
MADGKFFETDEEVADLLRRVETCVIDPDEFKHVHHLAVALLYALRLTEHEALVRMRESLLRLLNHHGLGAQVYHETLTAFWIRRVCAFVRDAQPGRPISELANALSAQCGDPRLVFNYYSKELIDSQEARDGWMEPDLRPFDF